MTSGVYRPDIHTVPASLTEGNAKHSWDLEHRPWATAHVPFLQTATPPDIQAFSSSVKCGCQTKVHSK